MEDADIYTITLINLGQQYILRYYVVVGLNLIALQKAYWLIQCVWHKSEREIIESLGLDFGDAKNSLELFKALNAKKDETSIMRIVNTLLLDTDLRRMCDSGWNVNFVIVREVVDDMLRLLESDGYRIEGLQVKPSGEALRPPLYVDILEGKFVSEKFYSELIQQINRCYRNNLFSVVSILFRKILENLVIDILRYKYGTTRLNLYYAPDRHRFHDFAVLLKNLKDNRADFQHYSPSVNDKLFSMIEQFREQGNSSAHSLDVFLIKDDIDKEKETINYLVGVLYELMQKVRADKITP